MINAEKYRDKILALTNKHEYFALKADNPTVITRCNNLEQCRGCLFDNGVCSSEKMKWLLSEYKEPVKITRFEYFILDWLLNSQCVRYIARDRNGNLYAHINKPCRVKYEWRGNVSAVDLTIFDELFAFVKWQNTEPTPIKDVLDNCEVVESDL